MFVTENTNLSTDDSNPVTGTVSDYPVIRMKITTAFVFHDMEINGEIQACVSSILFLNNLNANKSNAYISHRTCYNKLAT